MTCGVYGIFDRRTGACLYVGQSKHVEARWRQHELRLRRRARRALPAFVTWFHEGENSLALEFRLLQSCEDEPSFKNACECYWFDRLTPRFYGKKPSLTLDAARSLATREAIGAGVRRYLASQPKREVVLKEPASPSPFMALSREALVELYHGEELSMKTLGERYGVSQPRVLKRLQELKIERRARGTLTEGQKKLPAIVCRTCGQEFAPVRKERIFCSRVCVRR